MLGASACCDATDDRTDKGDVGAGDTNVDSATQSCAASVTEFDD